MTAAIIMMMENNKKRKDDKPLVVAITGTPGTGKTALSRIAAGKLGFTHVDVSELIKSNVNELGVGWDSERRTIIADTAATRRRIVELIRQNRKGSPGFVIDGHFSPEVCKPDLVIVLRCHPEKLRKRLKARSGWRELKVRENVEAECIDSCFIHAKETGGSARIIEIETCGTVSGDSGKVMDTIRSFMKLKKPGTKGKRSGRRGGSEFDYSGCLSHQ